jgi:hypothetical protein
MDDKAVPAAGLKIVKLKHIPGNVHKNPEISGVPA